MAFPWKLWWCGCVATACSTAMAAEPATGPGRARLAMVSSLESAGDHIRQRAFDGHVETSFLSRDNARKGDSLTMTFETAEPVSSVSVTTGRPDGSEPLSNGRLEFSQDGTTFEPAAEFEARGTAAGDVSTGKLRAVRIWVGVDLGHPLEIREFAIRSDRVKPFEHPFELRVVCDDAPDLKSWAEDTARLCEQWYDSLIRTLVDGRCSPPTRATLNVRKDYQGVAEAGGQRITASVNWFGSHRDDQGAIIHETIHLIQGYRGYGSPRCPSWLVEGIDDYIRFFVYEPGKAGPVNPRTANYDGSYRTTATFLDFVARKHDPDIIRKLDRALRDGTYDAGAWERLTGTSIEALNNEWLASIGAPKDRPARNDRQARAGSRPGRGPRRGSATANADRRPFPGKESRWEGFVRHDFPIDGANVIVVEPEKPLPGRPWAWRGEFFGGFPNADIELVRRGWHLAYVEVPDQFGSPKAMKAWEKVHDVLVKEHGLSHKPALIGLSRGALYCMAWAAAHPDRTLLVYLDNGVCDVKSWPGGQAKGLGRGAGSPEEWRKLLSVYGFKDDAEAIAFKGNPVDRLDPLARSRVPILLVYGDSDRGVPSEENSEIVFDRYRSMGGPVERIIKPGGDHHPHGLMDPGPIVEFFERVRSRSGN